MSAAENLVLKSRKPRVLQKDLPKKIRAVNDIIARDPQIYLKDACAQAGHFSGDLLPACKSHQAQPCGDDLAQAHEAGGGLRESPKGAHGLLKDRLKLPAGTKQVETFHLFFTLSY